MSTAGRSACRNQARTTRLRRLRPTARLSTFLEMAKPRRGWPCGLRAAITPNRRSPQRWPAWNTRWKSAGLSRRWERRKRPTSGLLAGEALAALGAAVLDDLATTDRGHAGAEAVGALAAQAVRLKSVLHGGCPTSSRVRKKGRGFYCARGPACKPAGPLHLRTRPGRGRWSGGRKTLWISRSGHAMLARHFSPDHAVSPPGVTPCLVLPT